MELSIIIVNWNSIEYVRACLVSIFKTVARLSFEVIVIDSGSGDGCGEMIAGEFPAVKFIASRANLGFPRANNVACAASSGQTLLFLNPDTEVRPNAVLELYRALHAHEDTGIVGARLLNSDGSLQTSCVQAFPTIWNQALSADLLHRWFPRARLWGAAALFAGQPQAVDMVSGACLMVKRHVFEHVGRFSTYSFMYVEDVDICLKAKKAGWNTCYVPSAEVVHHGGGSSACSVKAFNAVMSRESLRRFFCLTRGRGYARLFTLVQGLVAAQRCSLLLAACTLQTLSGSEGYTRRRLVKWSAILRWSLGREHWIKKYG